MRGLIVWFVVPLFLCGCAAYDYSAAYTTNCAITKNQAKNIAADIFRELGMTPKMTEYEGRLSIRIVVPYENKPGETIIPVIEITETDSGLVIAMEDNGKGDSPLSRKMKGLAEQALTRNGCSSWKFDDQASNFSFAK